MTPDLRERVARLAGRPVARVQRISGGGYTPAERWQVRFGDGASWFAKVGTTPLTAGWVRDEKRWYDALSSLQGDLLPTCHGLLDHPDQPALLLKDLSHARWPPPWEPGDVERVLAAVRRLAATPLPAGLPSLAAEQEGFSGWPRVAEDPGPFLALGRCSPAWLARALPLLLAAEAGADLDGNELVHRDLRSDNLCLLGERVAFVDWNKPSRGRSAFDLAFFAQSLRFEGGPLPEDVADGSYAALVAGYFAARAGLAAVPGAPRVRWIQRRQLAIALPWAARVLGLPPPDGLWARVEIAEVDRAYAAGAIDDATWHARIEEPLIDAYLASDDPRTQSGKSGDEGQWRWSRELVLEAADGGACALLDVGCANGLLLDSLVRWGAERGLHIDPYGVEISDRMARVARRAYPQLADRIAVGNALEWTPPRRFDLVHTGLDYVPPPRRRALVDRILRDLLRPGGRLVLRPERVGGTGTDPVEQLAAIGLGPDGVLERTHPRYGTRRTAWIAARRP